MQIPESEATEIRNRLARAQGQLGGVLRMLDEGRDCGDVITQLAAAQAAVSRAAFKLLSSGIAACESGSAGDGDRHRLEKAFLALS